jgi:ferrochelatase
LEKLAKEGIDRVDVLCPGFTSDCLETLEEIAMEAKQDFLTAGGKEFHYIPCLNESSEWITALTEVAEQHLIGWQTILSPQMREELRKDYETSRSQAVKLGAER